MMATPLTPEAPPNAMMGGAAPQMAPQAPAAGPNAMMAGGGPAPAAAPPAPMAAPPTQKEIDQAKKITRVMIDGLTDLLSEPRGKLTKKMVFDVAANMISRGAFPTPEDRQHLVVELANLPDDDEPAMRKALGGLLVSLGNAHQMIHGMTGA